MILEPSGAAVPFASAEQYAQHKYPDPVSRPSSEMINMIAKDEFSRGMIRSSALRVRHSLYQVNNTEHEEGNRAAEGD